MKESFLLGEKPASPDAAIVELDFQARQKSRHKVTTQCGQTLGWFLERGRVLQDGDVLLCNDGSEVVVKAADETVSEIYSDDPHLLMRAAYHLGNRHVPLQIDKNFLRYQHDHVLDAMLAGLGLVVECCQQPFHPESGAYHQGGHTHSQDGGHHHGHSHSHSHSHGTIRNE